MAYNSKYTGQEVENLLDQIPEIERIVNSHNKKLEFFAIEPVTVIVGGVEHHCEANQVATVFVGDEEFEIIPTSNNSIQSLLGYPIPLTWYDWLEGVDVFENIIFDMNNLDTYKHWIQYYQGDYHVQKAQYSNCVFWSDKPYTHSPFEERTNYTIYYSAELPMCYSTIPENTYKPFYLAYGVKTDPNWNNPDYVDSYSLVSGATQTFSYYGATAIGIFDMGVDIIKLPKDCRGLMYHAPAITHAGVFDAINTTNFGAKKGSWQEAFGDCISLTSLYIQNLKTSINISWSPINADSIEFIVNNAANTSAITISVSPYTWYRLSDEVKTAASAKNITIALLVGNFQDDSRWETKQDKEEGKGLSTEDFTTELKNKLSELGNSNILTCEFMGEVGDVIWSDDDQDRIEYIADWMEELSLGKVCVLDFDEYEGTYAMVHAINYRNDATYSIGKVIFSYVFEGYLYDVEYESVSLPVTLTIVNKTKIGGEGGSNTDGGAEPMVCAYRILTASPTHIELENYTYNGQTMNYREGAIILITNPLGEDVVFEGGTLTLDGNEYEADAFTLKVGATTLFTLGVDSGILFPVSSVGGATTTYVDQAIANAITNTLNTPV